MVAFNNIPGNLLVPFFYAEINSGGTPYEGQSKLLLIGQKLSGGTAAVNVPIGPVTSDVDVQTLAGTGSMLVEMFRAAQQNAPFQPIWILPLADPAGAAATGTVTITAPGVTGVGIISVAGYRLTVQVNAADNATTVAVAVRDAINAAGIPVSATNASGVVTVTSRHVGLIGNGLELRVVAEEANVFTTTNAVVVAIGTATAGAGTPVLTTALANCGDDEFDWMAGPYTDTTSLNAIRDFLSDTGTGRWSPIKQLYGHYISAAYGTLSTLVALGTARNDRHVSIVGSQTAPQPSYVLAAAVAGQAAAHLTDAPEVSRPLQTLELVSIKPPTDRSFWWTITDRQALYVDGIAACKVMPDGIVRIDRIVTNEQVNSAGVPDATFRDIETLGQMMFLTRYFRTEVSNRHARQALADDNPARVQEITTPADIRRTLIHIYEELIALGVTEKADEFAAALIVERDLNNATRVNAYLPVDVVNQLRVFAANITTYLQYR